MYFTEHDKKVVEAIADLWQDLGGDAEGFLWMQSDILEELRRRENSAKDVADA